MWWGKKETQTALTGIGRFIDEQQLTTEEQIKYKLEMFDKMAPFKQIQRIMVTIIMYHWIAWCANCFIAIWLGYFAQDEYQLLGKFIEYAKLELIWVPTSAAIGLYLSGGLPMFTSKK